MTRMKDSGIEWIGEVPEDWGITKLKYICRMQSGNNLTSLEISSENDGGKIFPVYGGNGIVEYVDSYNDENTIIVGRVGAYCGSVYLEQGICWVSDNAIFAKSKITKDEFFDYFLLKRLNLFNHHVGTGQQLLTQEILNNIEVPKPVTEQIELFNRKATSIFETIFTNSREIIRLQELSDLLLSRLAG